MAVQSLLDWCALNGLFIDSRISIAYEKSRGIHVVSRDTPIPPNVTLARIPKRAVLSIKSCTLSKYVPFELHGLGAQLGLAFTLYSEILQGETSRWYGYLISLLPPDLPVFWEYDPLAGRHETLFKFHPEISDPILLLRGTQVSKILMQRDDMGRTLRDSVDHYYYNRVVPVLNLPDLQQFQRQEHNLAGFREAFALVSSRSFLLDTYHGLAMTPVADAFNHVIENHVHIQSEFYVCPTCGSLRECEHDDDGRDHSLKPPEEHEEHDLYYEMMSNTEILPNEEVFNTYGEKLTNAQLLTQYGFILDPNDNDMIYFDMSEVVSLLRQANVDLEFPRNNWSDSDSPSRSLVTSTLVFAFSPSDPNMHFCINSDGKISYQLWRFMVQCLCTDVPSADTLDKLISTQLELEAALQTLSPSFTPGKIGQVEAWRSPFVPTITELARCVARLCKNKKENTGHFSGSDEDLGELLDALPNDQKRARLALSVIMSERSILDSCRFGWCDFVDGLGDIGCNDHE